MDNKSIHSNEKELFRRIAAGDQEAFSIIFRNYSNPLYWYAFKLLNSEFWAEELVQEVFVQLWSKRELLADVESPSAYMYRMIGNKALNRIRRQELEVKMQYFAAHTLHLSGAEEMTHGDKWDQVQTLLQAAVNSLPEQQKRIYQLKYQQGFSYEEIAGMLSISVNTVRNHMTKALQAIRSFLREKGGDLILLVSALLLIH